MTEPCNFEGMDCPDPENYAAVAKQLHETALQAEERIYCMEQLLRSAVNRPTYMATSTAIQGPFVNSNPNDNSDVRGLFNNANLTVNFANFSLGSAAPNGFRLPAGIWLVGAYTEDINIGGSPDNVYHQLLVTRYKLDPLTGSTLPLLDISANSTYESLDGIPNQLTVSGIFRFDGTESVGFFFRHGNTTGTVQIEIGAKVWMHKLSDANLLRVI